MPALVVRNLSIENQIAVTAHLVEHYGMGGLLSPDVSTYAQGRQRCWLEVEAPLGPTRPWLAGHHDERLWSFVTRLWPKAELGLITRGPVGIDLHRDAGYADFEACTINLGECTWLYEPRYQTLAYGPQLQAEPVEHRLIGGEVIRFNCKNRHGVADLGADRWSINLWRVSQKARAGFESVRR